MPEILSNPETLPLDAQPVRLSGQLLGRSGIENWLGQDLILQTGDGFGEVALCFEDWPDRLFVPIVAQRDDSPQRFDRKTGCGDWLAARGATVAIDLETLRSQEGPVSDSGHPIWSAILAFAAAIWGAYIIIQGGI